MASKKRQTQLGAYLCFHRKLAGITMRQLAKKMGVHWTLISQWESGRSRCERRHWSELRYHLGALRTGDIEQLYAQDLKARLEEAHDESTGPEG